VPATSGFCFGEKPRSVPATSGFCFWEINRIDILFIKRQNPEACPRLAGSASGLRRGRDSNPRYIAVHMLSKHARSATLTPLRVIINSLPEILFGHPTFAKASAGRSDTSPVTFWSKKRELECEGSVFHRNYIIEGKSAFIRKIRVTCPKTHAGSIQLLNSENSTFQILAGNHHVQGLAKYYFLVNLIIFLCPGSNHPTITKSCDQSNYPTNLDQFASRSLATSMHQYSHPVLHQLTNSPIHQFTNCPIFASLKTI
jgi:hypothetical protein